MNNMNLKKQKRTKESNSIWQKQQVSLTSSLELPVLTQFRTFRIFGMKKTCFQTVFYLILAYKLCYVRTALSEGFPKLEILYQDGIHPEELREILFVMKPQINTLIYFFCHVEMQKQVKS